MALSRKQLRELKNKMANTDPSGLKAARQASKQSRQVSKQKIVRDTEFTERKSIIRYSFKPNQLVEVKYGNEKVIGLVVSDFEYFSRRVEKNCFFVLVKGAVTQFDGRYIRQI
jgi:hypothetical protein